MKYLYFLIITLLTTLPLEARKIDLPAPIGEHKVGLMQKDYQTDEGRDLKVSLFYPTSETETNAKLDEAEILSWLRDYEDINLNAAQRVLNDYFLPESWRMRPNDTEDFRQKLNVIVTHVQKDAKVLSDCYPVVYFLHEYGRNPTSYMTLLTSIASCGYVVIASHHPGISGCVAFTGDRVFYENQPTNTKRIMLSDFNFLMKTLKSDRDLMPFCDFDNAAVIGHGLGGKVLQLSDSDEMKAIKAKVMLEEKTRNFLIDCKPSYYIFSSTVDAQHVAHIRNSLDDKTYLRVIQDFSYQSFSDTGFMLNLLKQPGYEDVGHFSEIYADFSNGIAAFLGRVLKNEDTEVPQAG